MIKAIFYSKFDTQEGKQEAHDLPQNLTTDNLNRPQSRPSSPRWRHRPLAYSLTTTSPLLHLLRHILLRNPETRTMRQPAPSLHKRIPYFGLPNLHEISSI